MRVTAFVRTTLLAGLVAWGVFDVYLAITIPYSVPGATAASLFQWDASNFFGNAAFQGGAVMITIGLIADLIVSWFWAALWVALAARLRFLSDHPIVSAVVFGTIVMCCMMFVIVPLGHATQGTPTFGKILNNLIAHTLFFAVPLALTAQAAGMQKLSAFSSSGFNATIERR